MKVTTNKYGDNLYIILTGELDEFAASSLRRQVDRIIDDNINSSKVIFNLSGLSFMDSTGIGFLLGRYKKLSALSTPSYIDCTNPTIDKIIALSGLYTVMQKIS